MNGLRRSGRPLALIAILVIAAAGPGAPALRAAPAAPAAPAGGFRVPAATRTLLKNGLVVLALERHEIPLVQMQLLVRGGTSADPAGKEGAAHLTAELLKRGTKVRPAQQFAEEVEFVGGSLEASADLDACRVTGEFASRDFEVGLNLLADMVLNPAFQEEEFGRAQRQAVAEATANLDDPEWVADRAFPAWLFGTHPYGRAPEGTRASLAAIAPGDVVAYHQAYFAPGNAVLVIVGDIGASQAAQRAEKYLGAWKKKAVPEIKLPEAVPIKGRKVLLIDKPEATQSQIRFGNLGLKRNDPESYNLAVGNSVLGGGFTSWLMREVREKRGLTYGIRSSARAYRSSGAYVVSTFSKNATVPETIQVALEQMMRLRSGEIPVEDLDKARNYLAGLYPVRIESPDALAAQILDIQLYGLDADYINQYQKRIRAVSLEAVKRAALRFVPLDDLAIVVVGPAAELQEPLAKLGPVTVRPIATALDAR